MRNEIDIVYPNVDRVIMEFVEVAKFSIDKRYAYPAGLIILCAVESLGSYLIPDEKENQKRFKHFISNYFPAKYTDKVDLLWKQLRNPLVHSMTIGGKNLVSCLENGRAFHLQEVSTESIDIYNNQATPTILAHTSSSKKFVFVNILELLQDLEKATDKYLKDIHKDPVIFGNYKKRLNQEINKELPKGKN